MDKMDLAVIQFPRSTGEPGLNYKQARDLIKQVQKADVVLLPEDWIGAHYLLPWSDYTAYCLELASCLPESCLLVAGAAFVETSAGPVSRGAFVYGSSGQLVPYEKHFPSHAIGERKFIEAGKQLPVIEYKGIKMGVLVCVDLFYPELARSLALKGVQVLFNPANIPDARMELWQQLGAARAAENTVYIAMANNTRTSYRDGRVVAGRSFIAFPDGSRPEQCGSEPGIYYFQLDMQLISKVRQRWRYLEDIRENRENIIALYGKVTKN